MYFALAPKNSFNNRNFFIVGSALILFAKNPALSISKITLLLNIVLFISIYKSMSFFLSLGLLLLTLVLYIG